MDTINTRQDILNFLIEVEIEPKKILRHKVNTKSKKQNEYLNNILYSILESYLLQDDYTFNNFKDDLYITRKNVNNKFN